MGALLERMARWIRGSKIQPVDQFVDRPGARIAFNVEDGETEGTPVVITHSFLASRGLEDSIGIFDWTPVRNRGKRLIRFDARGHGASSGEPGVEPYRWRALAEDLLAVADAAAPDHRAVDAIGESTGCGTLLWAVTKEPERFRRLVLVIPPTIRETRAEQSGIYQATADLIELRGPEAWSRVVDNFPPVPLLDAGGWARAREVPVSTDLLPSVLRGAAASDLPPEEALRALPQETLVLAWTTDPNHPTSSAEYFGEMIPRSRVHIASDPDDVRQWGEMVAEFLAG